MLNLLPHQKRKIIRNELKKRRTIVAIIFGASTIVILLIFLFPTYLLARVRFEQASEENIAVNRQFNADKSKEADFTEKQRDIITLLQKDPKLGKPMTALLEDVIANRGDNIVLSGFAINFRTEGEVVIVSGKSKTRDDLVLFKQTLEKDDSWSNVNLPIADLGPAKDNNFTFTLTVKENK